MFSCFPYSVLRNEKRAVSIPFRCLGVHQALLGSSNARVSGTTAEHAGCALGRGSMCGSSAAGGAAVARVPV